MDSLYQRRIRRGAILDVFLAGLLFASVCAAANPEPVSVGVTFVDPVAVRGSGAVHDATADDDFTGLLVTDSLRQNSTVVVDSTDSATNITISYH